MYKLKLKKKTILLR